MIVKLKVCTAGKIEMSVPAIDQQCLNRNIYIHIYIYIYYIYTNFRVNTIVRLPHLGSGDSQRQETFLATSVDKQTCKYDTRVLKPRSFPINPMVKEPQQDDMVSHIYKFIYIYIYIYIYIIYIYVKRQKLFKIKCVKL